MHHKLDEFLTGIKSIGDKIGMVFVCISHSHYHCYISKQ